MATNPLCNLWQFWAKLLLNATLVCFVTNVTSDIATGADPLSESLIAQSGQNVTKFAAQDLTWKVMLSFNVFKIDSEGADTTYERISQVTSPRTIKHIISKFVNFVDQSSNFNWRQIKIAGIFIIPSGQNETEVHLSVLFYIHKGSLIDSTETFVKHLRDSMENFFNYLENSNYQILNFPIGKNNFSYIHASMIEGNSACCKFLEMKNNNATQLPLSGRYVEKRVNDSLKCTNTRQKEHSLFAEDNSESNIEIPWTRNGFFKFSLHRSWSSHYYMQLLKTATICCLCSSSITFSLWVFIFKWNPTILSLRNRRINPQNVYISRKFSKISNNLQQTDEMDDALVAKDPCTDNSANLTQNAIVQDKVESFEKI